MRLDPAVLLASGVGSTRGPDGREAVGGLPSPGGAAFPRRRRGRAAQIHAEGFRSGGGRRTVHSQPVVSCSLPESDSTSRT